MLINYIKSLFIINIECLISINWIWATFSPNQKEVCFTNLRLDIVSKTEVFITLRYGKIVAMLFRVRVLFLTCDNEKSTW